jgi:hypothetical protein
VLQALEATGSPVTANQLKEIRAALSEPDEAAAVEKIQKLLDPMCLVGVQINPESRVTVQAGPAPKQLIEQGWRVFLVKVNNQAGVTAPLRCSSPNAAPLHESKNDAEPPKTISQRDVVQRWLDVRMYNSPPLTERLSGLALEYRVLERDIEVPAGKQHTESFRMERWINLAKTGWYSGDHHVHAAGCAHYSSPTQGVTPADMMRHIRGEDLNVGCVLTWGPCWYHQKENFEGHVSALSTPRNLMRYDVEVSGFPSSHAGHLVLLRLKEDDYPGTKRIEDWPSWDLPVLKWGKEQGGVVGFAHSGWGLEVPAKSLPTFEMPKFDGIGANEYIVDVTHSACDFISTVDTPAVWELNIWYHTLNCGFTTRISGETDFPCIYGERVGLGRVYVKMPADKPLDYDSWVEGIRDGRSYCCDGKTHLFNFEIDGLSVGEPGDGGRKSVLAAKSGQRLKIKCKAAGLLDEQPTQEDIAIAKSDLGKKPYWHIERARVKGTRQVPVELIVNGQAVDRKLVEADGRIEDVEFEYQPDRSSWIAIRVFPAAHTNPIFVEVDGAPIRASKRSAQWCLDAVERCWKSKSTLIRKTELNSAQTAYDHARATYRRIVAEAHDDLAASDAASKVGK